MFWDYQNFLFIDCAIPSHLQMPEKEGEDKTDTNSHDPGHDHEGEEPQVGHGLEDSHELGHWPELLSKDPAFLGNLLEFLLLIFLSLLLCLLLLRPTGTAVQVVHRHAVFWTHHGILEGNLDKEDTKRIRFVKWRRLLIRISLRTLITLQTVALTITCVATRNAQNMSTAKTMKQTW